MRIEVHHYHHSSPMEAGPREILQALRQMEKRLMTTLQDILAAQSAEDADITALSAEVQMLVNDILAIPAEIATAVQTTLDEAGVEEQQVRDAVAASDAKVRAITDKIVSAITPPPGDTVPAGGGDDTVAAPSGDDIVAAPSGDDTLSAPSGDDTVTSS